MTSETHPQKRHYRPGLRAVYGKFNSHKPRAKKSLKTEPEVGSPLLKAAPPVLPGDADGYPLEGTDELQGKRNGGSEQLTGRRESERRQVAQKRPSVQPVGLCQVPLTESRNVDRLESRTQIVGMQLAPHSEPLLEGVDVRLPKKQARGSRTYGASPWTAVPSKGAKDLIYYPQAHHKLNWKPLLSSQHTNAHTGHAQTTSPPSYKDESSFCLLPRGLGLSQRTAS